MMLQLFESQSFLATLFNTAKQWVMGDEWGRGV